MGTVYGFCTTCIFAVAIGHVARMSVDAPQKQLLFGWITDAGAKQHCPYKQAQWLNACIRQANYPKSIGTA